MQQNGNTMFDHQHALERRAVFEREKEQKQTRQKRKQEEIKKNHSSLITKILNSFINRKKS